MHDHMLLTTPTDSTDGCCFVPWETAAGHTPDELAEALCREPASHIGMREFSDGFQMTTAICPEHYAVVSVCPTCTGEHHIMFREKEKV